MEIHIEDIMTQLDDMSVATLSQIVARCKALRVEKIGAVKARRAEIAEEMTGLRMRAPRGSVAAAIADEPKPTPKRKKKSKAKRSRNVE